MKKTELLEKVKAVKAKRELELAQNKELMQSMYDSLDMKQKEKFDKDEKAKKVFAKHGVKHNKK